MTAEYCYTSFHNIHLCKIYRAVIKCGLHGTFNKQMCLSAFAACLEVSGVYPMNLVFIACHFVHLLYF